MLAVRLVWIGRRATLSVMWQPSATSSSSSDLPGQREHRVAVGSAHGQVGCGCSAAGNRREPLPTRVRGRRARSRCRPGAVNVAIPADVDPDSFPNDTYAFDLSLYVQLPPGCLPTIRR